MENHDVPMEEDKQVLVNIVVVKENEMMGNHDVPTEEHKQVSVNLIVVKENEPKVAEDKSDLKLGAIEPSTRIDGEPTVHAANEQAATENEVMGNHDVPMEEHKQVSVNLIVVKENEPKVSEDKSDSKLGVIKPSTRIDGEPTVDAANEQTATENEPKVAGDKSNVKHGAIEQTTRIDVEPTRGAAHYLDDAVDQLAAAGYRLKSAGQYLIAAGLHATGYSLIAAGCSLMTISISEVATAQFGNARTSSFGGPGTEERPGASEFGRPETQRPSSGTSQFAAPEYQKHPGTSQTAPSTGTSQFTMGSSSQRLQDYFSPIGALDQAKLVSDSGPTLEFNRFSSSEFSDGSLREGFQSGGSQSGGDGGFQGDASSSSSSPSDIIVGSPPRSPSYLKRVYVQR